MSYYRPNISRVLLRDIALLWNGLDDKIQTGVSVFVHNGIIQWVGDFESIPASLLQDDYHVVDMTNRLVTPGFVNTHHHMYQCLTKSIATDSTLFEWLSALYQIWKPLTPEMVYKAAKFAIAELLLSGCTLSTDLLYLFHNGIQLDDTIRAAQELGIRFQPCRGTVTIGESDGGLPPDSYCEDEEAVLVDMQRLIERYHDSHDGAMIRIALAPVSPFSVTEHMMRRAAKLARRYPKVMLHTHLAENSADMEYMRNTVRKSLPEYLEDCNWNKSDCWFAHCVKLSSKDETQLLPSSLDYFTEKKLGIAHCATSNCRLGSGIAPVQGMLERKIKVGVGVDGSASNDGGNMLSEIRTALLLARARAEDASAISAIDALKMATSGGAAVLGRGDVGSIQPGKCGDLVGWRLDAPAFAGALHSKEAVLNALVLGHGGELRADYVMIHGRAVVNHGKLSGNHCMKDITRELNEASLELAEKAGLTHGKQS